MAESTENAVKIVLGIDDSENSERAFQYYMDVVHKDGYELIMVHAMEYPYISETIVGIEYISEENYEKIFKDIHENADKIAKKFEDLCAAAKVKCTVFKGFANPGEYVVKMAEDHSAKMIVMGTRGMGAIRRTILGSVYGAAYRYRVQEANVI